ncbi:hypothetical protein ACQCRK_26470, partial [Ralstonia pseudosolanacearum]
LAGFFGVVDGPAAAPSGAPGALPAQAPAARRAPAGERRAAARGLAPLQNRQGLMVACPEEIAYRNRWISAEQVAALAKPLSKNGYGQYLQHIISETVK